MVLPELNFCVHFLLAKLFMALISVIPLELYSGKRRGKISVVANTGKVYASLAHFKKAKNPKGLWVCVLFSGDLDSKPVHDSYYDKRNIM